MHEGLGTSNSMFLESSFTIFKLHFSGQNLLINALINVTVKKARQF